MSKISDNKEKVLQEPSQFFIIIGTWFTTFGFPFYMVSVLNLVIHTDSPENFWKLSLVSPGVWIALALTALGGVFLRFGRRDYLITKYTNESLVTSILENKYDLKINVNPITQTKNGSVLTPGSLSATLDGNNVKVIIKLSPDGTDVIAYAPGADPIELEVANV